jgi:hypothetical protein
MLQRHWVILYKLRETDDKVDNFDPQTTLCVATCTGQSMVHQAFIPRYMLQRQTQVSSIC